MAAFSLCCLVSWCALWFAKLAWQDSRSNLFAFCAGTGNTGYFGLPLALSLYGDQGAALAAAIIVGVNIYEFSVGYFWAAKGLGSVKESVRKIVQLPVLYAFLTAAVMQRWGLTISDDYAANLASFKGAYSVLGMLVIGIALSAVPINKLDWKYLLALVAWKHLTWPLLGIVLTQLFFSGLGNTERAVIQLMSCVPMAGNAVVIASQLGIAPEKAASAVMASTLLALLTVPGWLLLLRGLG